MPTSLLVAHYHKDLAPGRLVEIFDSQEVNVQVESRRSIPDHASSSFMQVPTSLASEKPQREGARPQNWLLCGLAVKAWHRNSWRFENNSRFRGPHSQLQR